MTNIFNIVILKLFLFSAINLSVKLKFDKSKISKGSELNLNIDFRNIDVQENYLLPKHLQYGEMKKNINDKRYNLLFNVEKLSNSKYSFLKMDDIHEPMPLSFPIDELYDTLSPNMQVRHNVPLLSFYTFIPGKYRIQVKLILPQKSNLKEEYVQSEWLYFTISKNYNDTPL